MGRETGSSPSLPGDPQPQSRHSRPERSCCYFELITAPPVVPPVLIEFYWAVRSAPLYLSAYFPWGALPLGSLICSVAAVETQGMCSSPV